MVRTLLTTVLLASAAVTTAGATTAGATTAAAATSAPRAGASLAADPGSYVPLGPTRILDTRTGAGTGGRTVPVPARGSISFVVAGANGVPDASQVSAVVFNLTRTGGTASGYVAAYPAGTGGTATSVLNSRAGETRAHEVVIAPGSNGQVTLVNGSASAVDLIADLAGYYTAGTPTAGGEFAPVSPQRIYDTRTTDDPLHYFDSRAVQVTGVAGVPASNVSMVAVNVTATASSAGGYLQVNAADPVLSRARGSNVNFVTNQATSNLVLVPVDPQGRITIKAILYGYGERHVHVVVDVFGWFAAGQPTVAGRTGGLPNTRLLDTRLGTAVPARGTRTIEIAGAHGLPAGLSAASVTLTVPAPPTPGYLTAYPSGTDRPTASTINFGALTQANTTLVPLGRDGTMTVYNGSDAAQNVVVDVQAYVGPLPGPLT